MSQRFKFIKTPLKGLIRVERQPIVDSRGSFSRFFCAEEFKEIGFASHIVQMNYTLTRQKGAVRGMHFQFSPYTETKIVTCLQGEILDVAIDIRQGSPTFLEWHAELLSEKNQSSLYIPGGFAHGFQALTDNCQLLYLHSQFYTPDAEGTLNVLDPAVAIDWPLEVTDISERDRNHQMLDDQFMGIVVS